MKIEIIYGPCFKGSTGEWHTDGLLTQRFTMDFGTGLHMYEIENAACAVAQSHVGKGKFVVARPAYNDPNRPGGFYEWRSFDDEYLTQVDF